MRRRLVWLVTLPLAIAGGETAHAAANALLGPPRDSIELLSGDGPGAILVPGLAAGVVAVLLLALAGRVAGTGGSRPAHVSALQFALLAPLVYILQEHVELYLQTGSLPLGTVLEPTFLPGLAIQLPFALAAYLVARALLRLADGLRQLIERLRPERSQSPVAAATLVAPSIDLPRPLLFPLSLLGRGPPAAFFYPG